MPHDGVLVYEYVRPACDRTRDRCMRSKDSASALHQWGIIALHNLIFKFVDMSLEDKGVCR